VDSLNIFIAVTAAAVVIQAGILVFMYLAIRQSGARMEALADEVNRGDGSVDADRPAAQDRDHGVEF